MRFEFIIAGLLGGVVRGLVGYVKYLSSYKGVKFDWKYFVLMAGLSGLVGGISGYIFNGIMEPGAMNQFYAFLAGYAGGDFLENAFKIVFKKPTLFKMPEILEKSLKV
jgi:membrane associated rhomboid family serine protease